MTVNNTNGAVVDGQDGQFVASLPCPEGNWMQVVTADGQVIFGKFLSAMNMDVHGALTGALEKWRALPQSQRKPGAVKVPQPSESAEPLSKSPAGGLILRVYQRAMKRDGRGELALITKRDTENRTLFPDSQWGYVDAIMAQPMPDVMWLTEAEWKALVPATPKKGDQFDVPAPIKMRLFRYHLINGTTSMPLWRWGLTQVLREDLTLTVEEVAPILRLRLRGTALMARDEDLTKAQQGYDTRLTGILEYDPSKKAFTRFDFVAVGDWWGGDWEGNRFARPGRNPLGIAFELANGDRASDLVPPNGFYFKDQANGYFAADKEH